MAKLLVSVKCNLIIVYLICGVDKNKANVDNFYTML